MAPGVEHFAVALDLGPDHGSEDDRIDRLGQELVAAEAQGFDLLRDIGFAGQVDHRQRPVFGNLAQGAGDFDAGAEGHVHVHQDGVRVVVGGGLEQDARVADRPAVDAVLRQRTADVGDGGGRVFDDQYAMDFMFACFDQIEDARQHVADLVADRDAGVGAGPLQADDAFQAGGH